MMKRLRKKVADAFHRLSVWHKWNVSKESVALLSDIDKHFNLSDDENAMLNDCIRNKLLKEYVVFSPDKSKAYIVVKVRECMNLVKKRRENIAS